MPTNHKAARRVNEQYHCHHCGKQWDYNDPDPPECVTCRDCDDSGKFYQMEGVDCHCIPDSPVENDLYTPKQRYKSDNPGGYYCNDCDRWYCNSSPCLHH